MDEQLRQIGERLRGLRDVLDIEASEMATLCGISLENYLAMEKGESELSVANLQKIAKQYGVRSAYNYESLASGFRGRKADPFIVTVEPKPIDTPKEMNSHSGQEFNMVLEGSMELTIGPKVLTLQEGDSVYFDATQPHGMRTLNDKPVRFLAIIF